MQDRAARRRGPLSTWWGASLWTAVSWTAVSRVAVSRVAVSWAAVAFAGQTSAEAAEDPGARVDVESQAELVRSELQAAFTTHTGAALPDRVSDYFQFPDLAAGRWSEVFSAGALRIEEWSGDVQRVLEGEPAFEALGSLGQWAQGTAAVEERLPPERVRVEVTSHRVVWEGLVELELRLSISNPSVRRSVEMDALVRLTGATISRLLPVSLWRVENGGGGFVEAPLGRVGAEDAATVAFRDRRTGAQLDGGGCLRRLDVEGDGTDELYVGTAQGWPDRVYALRDGEFVDEAPRLGLASPAACLDVAVVDLDGDDRPELIRAGRTLSIWTRGEDGRFTEAASIASPLDQQRFTCVAVGDLDGDGRPDVFGGTHPAHPSYLEDAPFPPTDARGGSGSVAWINQGDLAFEGAPAPIAGDRWVADLAWFDADADGRDDLVLGVDHGPLRVASGGRFGLAPGSRSRHPFVTRCRWLDAADLDGDGHADLVVGAAGSAAALRRAGDRELALAFSTRRSADLVSMAGGSGVVFGGSDRATIDAGVVHRFGPAGSSAGLAAPWLGDFAAVLMIHAGEAWSLDSPALRASAREGALPYQVTESWREESAPKAEALLGRNSMFVHVGERRFVDVAPVLGALDRSGADRDPLAEVVALDVDGDGDLDVVGRDDDRGGLRLLRNDFLRRDALINDAMRPPSSRRGGRVEVLAGAIPLPDRAIDLDDGRARALHGDAPLIVTLGAGASEAQLEELARAGVDVATLGAEEDSIRGLVDTLLFALTGTRPGAGAIWIVGGAATAITAGGPEDFLQAPPVPGDAPPGEVGAELLAESRRRGEVDLLVEWAGLLRPLSDRARIEVARAHGAAERWPAVLVAVGPIVPSSRVYADALAWTGRAHRALRNLPGSEQAFAERVRRRPTDAEARAELGLTQLSLGKESEAEAQLHMAFYLGFEGHEFFVAFAEARLSQGFARHSIEIAGRASELDPEPTGPWRVRAQALHALKDFDSALAAIGEAVSRDAADPQLRWWAARILMDAGRWSPAGEALDELERLAATGAPRVRLAATELRAEYERSKPD